MLSSGYVSLLYSIGKKPLEYWSKSRSQTGCIRKILDSDLLENVVELQDLQKSTNSNTFITSPPFIRQLLDVRLPFLVIIIKNMNVECHFRVQIVDTDENRHHLYFSNETVENSCSKIQTPVMNCVQVNLEPGWNRIEIDLGELTERAFQSQYKATQRLAICANCRLRRIYFVDRHYDDAEISEDLCKAFLHHYVMIKRGICLKQKPSCYENISMKRNVKNKEERRHLEFLNNLQIKSAILIGDFFSRAKTRLENVFDFENKIRLMFLSIPNVGDQLGNLERYYEGKQKHGDPYCMTPTRGDSLKSNDLESSIDRYKKWKTEPNPKSSDPMDPKVIKKSISVSKQTRRASEDCGKTYKQDKLCRQNWKASSSAKKGSSTYPDVISGKSALENNGNGSLKDDANIPEKPLDNFQAICVPEKPVVKKNRRRGTRSGSFTTGMNPKLKT